MTNKNKMKKEEQKKKELTRKEQKRRKRYQKIKFLAKLFLLLTIIIGGAIFAMTSPLFYIKEIQVIHNQQVSSDTIISLSELRTDENIFRFYTPNVIEKIKENAYIESVTIHRKLPSTIQIDIQERIPQYSVDFMEKYAYINNQGYILEIAEESLGMPIIQGIDTKEDQVVVNQRLNNKDLQKLEDVIKIMSIAKENNLDTKVTSIDIKSENEYSLYIEQEQKRIHLGNNTNLNNKLLYAIAIVEDEKGKAGDIYVNGDLNNQFRPYFREKV